MSKVFFISDTHFLHDNIAVYCNRPADFNKLIIENWNSVVSPEDYVFHLGDFSAGVNKHQDGYDKLKKISKALNGEKYLVKGNHDHYSDNQYIYDLGFSKVQDFIIYKNLFLCHYPLIIDKYTKPEMVANINIFKEKFKASGCEYLVHGHSHLNKFGGKRINVSVEQTGYTPILEQDLISLL